MRIAQTGLRRGYLKFHFRSFYFFMQICLYESLLKQAFSKKKICNRVSLGDDTAKLWHLRLRYLKTFIQLILVAEF
jgi:hypothetical protein